MEHLTTTTRSVDELVNEASNFDFVTGRPLRSWLRTAKTLLTQATISEQQHDLQTAFLLTYRHAILVLEKLPQYPSAEKTKYSEDLSQARKRVKNDLLKLEAWKPQLQKAHDQAVKDLSNRKSQVARQEQQSTLGSLEIRTSRLDLENEDDRKRRSVDAADNRALATQLARYELLRRGHASYPEQGEQPHEVSRMILDTAKALHSQIGSSTATSDTTSASSRYNYPAVPAREARVDWSSTLQPVAAVPPQLPSKVSSYSSPLLPPKEISQPTHVKFKIKAYTEGGEGLRSVLLPSKLYKTFLNLVHPNTAANLETCGVLGASLVSNALMITHLIIPDQTSSSNTCDTTEAGDVALFDYCEDHDLIVCGWIHTHPSQTCFLSSRDLHTTSGYQQMLPEAIAIVCAPRHNPDIGIFRLTNPPGLPAVLRCNKPGLFHPHDEKNLYTDAASPGHVIQESQLNFQLVDLRSAKA